MISGREEIIMIYLVTCDSIAYEAFTDEQEAIDRKDGLNKTLSIMRRLLGFRWAVQKMLLR